LEVAAGIVLQQTRCRPDDHGEGYNPKKVWHLSLHDLALSVLAKVDNGAPRRDILESEQNTSPALETRPYAANIALHKPRLKLHL
jgi:hypothetical protein